MPSLIEIDESGIVPRDKLFFDDGQENRLPEYNLSEKWTLDLTDCHAAFLSTVRKARLIGVEIASRKEPSGGVNSRMLHAKTLLWNLISYYS